MTFHGAEMDSTRIETESKEAKSTSHKSNKRMRKIVEEIEILKLQNIYTQVNEKKLSTHHMHS